MENVITPGVEWGGRRGRSSASASLALVHGLADPTERAAMTESEQLALILDLHRLRTQVDAVVRRVACSRPLRLTCSSDGNRSCGVTTSYA